MYQLVSNLLVFELVLFSISFIGCISFVIYNRYYLSSYSRLVKWEITRKQGKKNFIFKYFIILSLMIYIPVVLICLTLKYVAFSLPISLVAITLIFYNYSRGIWNHRERTYKKWVVNGRKGSLA